MGYINKHITMFLKKKCAIVIFAIICSCSNTASNNCYKSSIGTYLFSNDLSKVDISQDSSLFNGLTITLKADRSFNMSKKIPHLNDSTGNWKVVNKSSIEGRNVNIHIRLFFNNGVEKQISCCCENNYYFSINCPFLLSEAQPSKYGFISFVKIN